MRPCVHEEWLLARDCPLAGTDPWADRPGVITPDPRIVLAGDGVRCEHPVALMERAATTGWMAANELLARRGLHRSRPLDRADPGARAGRRPRCTAAAGRDRLSAPALVARPAGQAP